MAASQCASASFSAPVIRSVAARLNRYCGTSGRAATARRKNSFALLCKPRRPKIAPSASCASAALPTIFDAASAASKARRASPETIRHFARRMSGIGSFGSRATARSAQTMAASGRPRCSAVSVRSAQAVPSSGVRATSSAQIRSAVDTSPLAKARRASFMEAELARGWARLGKWSLPRQGEKAGRVSGLLGFFEVTSPTIRWRRDRQ